MDDYDDIDYLDEDGRMFDLVRGNIYAKDLHKRINHTPNKIGEWDDEKGTSFFRITDGLLLERLKRYECNGIYYNEYAEPDFSKYAIAVVWIENMGCSRRKNFKQATEKFLMSEMAKEEKIDDAKAFSEYKKKKKLSWHECSDGVTMMLLPRIIHQTFTHCGGVAEHREIEKQEREYEEEA